MAMIETPAAEPGHFPPMTLSERDLVVPFNSTTTEVETGILMRLRRRKLLFASTFIFVLLLVAGGYLYLPPSYKADAAVTISPPDRVLPSQQASDVSQTIGDSQDLESQALILSSPLLIREMLAQPEIRADLTRECEATTPPAWKAKIRETLRLKPTPSCAVQLDDMTSMVASIRGRLGVAANGRSRVINVSFTSPLADVAQSVANGVSTVYLTSRAREKQQPRDEAIEWLREESKRIADRLKSTEAQIETYLHANGVVKGQTASIASEQLTSVAQQLAIAEAERAAAAGRMQQANSAGGGTSSTLDNRSVNDVKQQLSAVQSQIAQLTVRYGDNNPALAEPKEQRRVLQGLLGRETGLVNRSAVADYQAASSRVTTLRQQLDALKKDVRGNDDATTQVASLQREATTDHELYVDLTKSLNQLETNRRLVTANARLVSLAELPQSVFFPKLSTFALTGLLLATALASVVALLRDRADRTVRGVDSLQDAVRLRVLSRVPYVPRMGRGAALIAKRIQRPSAFQEAIRGLYAECLLVSSRPRAGDRPLRSIMTSSANSGEGKSFITLALAHFAAAAGRRVLVLECDLRRPSVGRSLGLTRKEGVTEILRGAAIPEEVVCSANPGGLDVILAGRPAMDSTELLGSPRFQALLDWANEHYDLVLVDTPPSRAVPDARILAPHMDGILYCCQWGRSNTLSVVEGVAEIRASGGRVLGLVLDRVEQEHYRLYDSHSQQAGSYLIAGGR